MSKKTDWQIARDLADWVISLGIPEYHAVWAGGKEVDYSYCGNYVKTYKSGDFVAIKVKKGDDVYEVGIHKNSVNADQVGISKQFPTPEEAIEESRRRIEAVDIRHWNRVIRGMLRPLEKGREARLKEQRKEEARELKERLKELENKDD